MVKSRGKRLRGRQWLDDAKKRTRLSSTDMWFEPENRVAWRKRVSRDAPNRLYSLLESTFKIQDQQDRLRTTDRVTTENKLQCMCLDSHSTISHSLPSIREHDLQIERRSGGRQCDGGSVGD